MYGREDAGHSSTIATHHPDEATRATAARPSCQSRLSRRGFAATKYTSRNAGITRNACSILVLKPQPTRAAALTSHHVLPFSTARTVQ